MFLNLIEPLDLMTMRKINYTLIYRLMAVCFIAIALPGCQDDMQFHDPTESVGEPVTVTLQLSLPEMTPQSRADISDDVANEVTDIWVGIFDTSGNLTGYTHTDVNHKDTHNSYPVTIDTKTGPSHIVAIANAANNNGVMLPAENADSRAQTTILDILYQKGKNLTWSEFLSLAYLSPQAGSIETPNGHIPMCGVYYNDSDPENHPTDSWESLYNQTIDIPADGKLNGHIHLRRLMSQVKVQLQTTGNIIDIEPYSWQVINVPRASWLLERNEGNINATDAVTGVDKWLDDSPVHGPEYFPFIDKVKFNESGNYVHDGNDKAFVFDFWQTENKHTISCSNYKERESAARNKDVTYIEFKCRITYKTIPETSSQDQYLDGGTVSRTADATYIIPLGGINKDYSDFNHRRNSRYIYNVTISDVTQILVEAHELKDEINKDNLKRPGVEGIVTDLTNPMVHLDAHYSVMNVRFTRAELRGTDGKFPFLLRVRDKDDKIIEIDQNNYSKYTSNTNDALYVNWIEVMHTDDQNKYAVYKPASTSSTTTKYIYKLAEFAEIDNIWKTDQENEEQWFTVFFNEYVYETGSTTYKWKDYVNKGNREVWFLANKFQSNDKNSIHLKAKYSASQQSIQTYYSNNADKAIGVEHLNETLGARLRWTTPIDTAQSNGKINLVRYINKIGNKKWDNYVQRTTPLKIPRITNQKGIAEQAVYVPSPALLSEDKYVKNNCDPTGDNTNYYVEVINACMNRNRDLNGDGVIENSELRWYVPTARQYQRIILGRMSLTSPIMQDFENITLVVQNNSTSNINTRYHIAASDKTKIWAEEGLSKSDFDDGEDQYGEEQFNSWRFGAWQVRCIRNLGGDANYQDEKDLLIPTAYTHDKTNRIIKLDNYETKSKRDNMIVGDMPPHHIYDQSYNRLYKAFQYAETSTDLVYPYSPSGGNYETNNYATRWTNILNNSNPCVSLNTNVESGWRVPNQKELTILFYLDVIKENPKNGEVYYLSATHEYFSTANGMGFSGDRSRRRYLGTIEKSDGVNSDATAVNFNLGGNTFKTRCVRDVEP